MGFGLVFWFWFGGFWFVCFFTEPKLYFIFTVSLIIEVAQLCT